MPLPIAVKLQPSHKLAVLLFAVHLVALWVVAIIEAPDGVRLILAVLIIISLWNDHVRLHGARRIVLLTLRDKGVLEYVRLDDEAGAAGIHLQSAVTPLLAVILLRQGRRLETLMLLPDSLSRDDYRCLRLWLRWQNATS